MSTRMFSLRRLAAAVFVSSAPFVPAQQSPAPDALAKLVPEGTVVYVQASSLDRLDAAVAKVAKLFKPGDEKVPQIDELLGQAGLPGAVNEIDHLKPIAFCLVLPAQPGGQPAPAFFVPAKSPENLVRSMSNAPAKVKASIAGDYVCISESPAVKPGAAPAAIALGLPAGELVARIDVKRIVAYYRPMIEMGLGQLESSMASAPSSTVNGLDLKPMLKVYMDGVRSIIDSGETLDLALRLDGDRLEFASAMAMIDKSVLAGFGSKTKTDVKSLARFLDPEASIQGVVGVDQAVMLQRFKPAIDALLSAYPEPMRSGFQKMMGSADELAAQIGTATCFSGDFGAAGMRFAVYVHPRDPNKLLAIYRKMLGSMPSITMEEPKEVDLDGAHVTRTHLRVDSKALVDAQGKAGDGKSQAELTAMLEKLYGKDGLSLSFATVGDVTAIVVGGDEAFLHGAIARASKPGNPTPSAARAIEQVGDMNPCFVVQYNLGKVLQGLGDLMGEQLPDLARGAPKLSATLVYTGAIDGRVWRGSVSTDLSALGTTMHSMKGPATGGGHRQKAQADIRAISSALTAYVVDNGGKYPDTLDVLLKPDGHGKTYLNTTGIPRDPWGREYRYDAPSKANPRARVYSYGKDGKPGGVGEDADIDDANGSRPGA
jgi:general secretion pathway protein G